MPQLRQLAERLKESAKAEFWNSPIRVSLVALPAIAWALYYVYSVFFGAVGAAENSGARIAFPASLIIVALGTSFLSAAVTSLQAFVTTMGRGLSVKLAAPSAIIALSIVYGWSLAEFFSKLLDGTSFSKQEYLAVFLLVATCLSIGWCVYYGIQIFREKEIAKLRSIFLDPETHIFPPIRNKMYLSIIGNSLGWFSAVVFLVERTTPSFNAFNAVGGQ